MQRVRPHDRDSASPPHGDPRQPAAAWTIEGLVAKQALDASCVPPGMTTASIHLDQPSAGIGFGGAADGAVSAGAVSVAGLPIVLLGLLLDPPAEQSTDGAGRLIAPTDRWVRGEDVVAVYEPQDPRSLRATAMWRRWPTGSPAVAAWELVVSCQTSLLESDASVVVRTIVPPSRVSSSGATAALARTASGPTVLVATHPLEGRRLTIASPSDGVATGLVPTAIDCRLFPSFVEKGVLLRGRVLAAVGPREQDDSWSSVLIDRFGASPPPLTT